MLVYIGFPYSHHKDTHAGYHQIQGYVHYDYLIDCTRYIEKADHAPKSIFERILRSFCWRIMGIPFFPSYIFKCILIGMFKKNVIFHFIYGENTFVDFKMFIRKSNKIVCTFHQPAQWFNNTQWKRRLKQIDNIILVGNTELDLFKNLTLKDNVVFIPHGIRTDFYHEAKKTKEEHIVLTVGNWLRDYEFADEVYQKLLGIDDEIKIYVVAMPKTVSRITHHPRLFCLSGITDESLRTLYYRSSVLFLPLKRYTANNSLLEASACGCNILIASDYQENSYIPLEYLNICCMDVNKVVDEIMNFVANPKYNYELAKYVMNNYSWELIGKKTESYLNSLK